MPHNGFTAPGPRRATSGRRRHPDIAPHILAHLDPAQHGDRDAFAEHSLLNVRRPVTDAHLATAGNRAVRR